MNIMLDVLRWCSDNDVILKIRRTDTGVFVEARRAAIQAHYVVKDPADNAALGAAALMAMNAVKYGTEYHQKNGMFPPKGN